MNVDREKRREIETEREKRNEVVRIFLFQSRSEHDIRDDENLKEIQFTNLVLIKKSKDANNPNQLMPVGGAVEKRETAVQAGRREAVEETHLRPPLHTVIEMQAQQDYDFYHHKKQQTVYNHSKFLIGRLLPAPMDVPFQLSPKEDKIDSFLHLSFEQAQQLLNTGRLQTDDTVECTLLDSLSPDARDRVKSRTHINDQEVSGVRNELLFHFQRVEAAKKMDVLLSLMLHKLPTAKKDIAIKQDAQQRNEIIRMARQQKAELELFENEMSENEQLTFPEKFERASKAIDEANRIWKALAHHFTANDIRQALKYDNLQVKIENATEKFNEETGHGVPTIDFVLPLILGREIDSSELKIIMKNSHARRVLRMMKAIGDARRQGITDGQEIIGRLSYRDPEHPEIEPLLDVPKTYFEVHKGKIDGKKEFNLSVAGVLVDEFFKEWQQADTKVKFVDQLNEIKGADLIQIFEYAIGNIPDKIAKKILRRQKYDSLDRARNILQWEARRKLAAIFLLNESIRVHNHVLERGIAPIRELEEGLVEAKAAEYGGSSISMQLFLEQASTDDRHGALGFHKGYKNVLRYERVKSLRGILRKIIVRDQLPEEDVSGDIDGDAFAESYFFEGNYEAKDLEIKEYCIPYDDNLVDDEFDTDERKRFVVRDRTGKQLDKISAPQIIADFIKTLLINGRGHVEIEAFKPLPPIGQAFESAGPGGGGKVRFCKFYIKHVDENNVARYREVHVYVPDSKRKTKAYDEYVDKIQDDKEYRVQRLFMTHGLRSMMELLFPAEIYGDDVRKMYAGRAG
ncbi:MAG: NUDIX domain-containing protein [Patescibacteria group bacterium]